MLLIASYFFPANDFYTFLLLLLYELLWQLLCGRLYKHHTDSFISLPKAIEDTPETRLKVFSYLYSFLEKNIVVKLLTEYSLIPTEPVQMYFQQRLPDPYM